MTDKQRKALEALNYVRNAELYDGQVPTDIIRQALTEPTVPDAVRELVHDWRNAVTLNYEGDSEREEGMADAILRCADDLERALAQQGDRTEAARLRAWIQWYVDPIDAADRTTEDVMLEEALESGEWPEPDSGEGDD